VAEIGAERDADARTVAGGGPADGERMAGGEDELVGVDEGEGRRQAGGEREGGQVDPGALAVMSSPASNSAVDR
jgi:hypothetical protein